MSDRRFFSADGPFTLGDIAQRVAAELVQPERAGEMIHDIADLELARGGEASLFCDARHAGAFAASKAGVIVTSRKLCNYPHNGSALLLTDDPRLAFARIGHIFYPRAVPGTSIHPSAWIDPSAVIGLETSIGAGAVIDAHAVIGPRCRIGANAVIAESVSIGAGSVIGAGCSISHALVGDRVVIASNASIGGQGFGFVPAPEGLLRISQIGRVVIGDDVQIGSGSAIDRGALGDTVIGAMTVIDNLVQIGHNVKIGRGCVLAGQAGVAGSTTIGDFVMVGGAAAITDHLVIGTGAKIAGGSGVMRDVAPGEIVAGYPAVPVRQWHRQTAALARLIARRCSIS